MNETATGGYRFSSLVAAVIKSVPFEDQRADATGTIAKAN
jgi:hypothetical protein